MRKEGLPTYAGGDKDRRWVVVQDDLFSDTTVYGDRCHREMSMCDVQSSKAYSGSCLSKKRRPKDPKASAVPEPSQNQLLQGRSQFLVIALVTLIALALRLHRLGEQLSYDESVSAVFASLSLREFVATLWGGEGNMALFYVLVRAWSHVGYGEAVLRCFSLFFGVATIPAVYELGRRFVDKKVGLAGAALLAANGFHIRYSQFLRSYALAVFLLVVSTYLFLAALESARQKKTWAAYVLVSALAVYAHVLALLVLIAQWLSLGPAALKRIGLGRLLWIVVTGGLLMSPMAAEMLLERKSQIDWIPSPTLGSFVKAIADLAGSYRWSLPHPAVGLVLLVPFAVFWALAALGMVYSASAELEVPMRSVALRVLTLWLVFPIGAMLLFSLIRPLSHPQSLWNAQYVSLCLPAAMLVAGEGISVFSKTVCRLHWVFPVVLASMLALSAVGVEGDYVGRSIDSRNFGLRTITSYILARQRPADAIFFDIPWEQPYPYLYYTHLDQRQGIITTVPPAFSGHLTPEWINSAAEKYERIWVVWETAKPRSPEQVALIRSGFERSFQLAGEQEFPGHGIALFVKRLHKDEDRSRRQ